MSRFFASLRQLHSLRRQVPTTTLQSLVTSLVLPHIDYCNSMLYGLPTTLIRRLQSVENATVRLIFSLQLYSVPSTFPLCSTAHQPSLAVHPWAHFLQIRSFNITSHSWRRTELSTVLVHSHRRHAVTTMTALIRLWSPACTNHPSIYTWKSRIHSFWRQGMEQPAGSRNSCAITHGLKKAPQDTSVSAFIPWHCSVTHRLYVLISYTRVDLVITLLFRPC